MKKHLVFIIALILSSVVLASEDPQITFIASARGTGIILNSVPNDLTMSTRKNGPLVMLTFTSRNFADLDTITFGADVNSKDVSKIGARILGAKLEIVLSLNKTTQFSDISYKQTADGKGMILLSRKSAEPLELVLSEEGRSKLSRITTSTSVDPENIKTTPKKPVSTAKVETHLKPSNENVEMDVKSSTKQPVIEKKPPKNESVVIYLVKNQVNVRSSRKTVDKSNIIDKYAIGTRFVADTKLDGWYQVSLEDKNGEIAWVHSSVAKDSAIITPDVWDIIHNFNKIEADQYAVLGKRTINDTQASNTTVAENSLSIAKGVNGTSAFEVDVKKDSLKVEQTNDEPKAQYHAYARDPFLPLDKSGNLFVNEDLAMVDSMDIVGILYDETNAIALFEETRKSNKGVSFTLMKGDAIVGGKVLQIYPDKVVFLMQEFNYSYTVEKVLKSQKE